MSGLFISETLPNDGKMSGRFQSDSLLYVNVDQMSGRFQSETLPNGEQMSGQFQSDTFLNGDQIFG